MLEACYYVWTSDELSVLVENSCPSVVSLYFAVLFDAMHEMALGPLMFLDLTLLWLVDRQSRLTSQ